MLPFQPGLALDREYADAALAITHRFYVWTLSASLRALWEQYMDASEYLAMMVARNLAVYRLLFPEFYEHPRYQEMLRKHLMDDESVHQLKVSPLSF